MLINSFLLFVCWLVPSRAQGLGHDVKYRHFDDYLSHMDRRDRFFISGEQVAVEDGSGDAEPELENSGRNAGSIFNRPSLPIRTGSTRSKEVSCCMLGQLAGDKGYHCFAKFYAARLLFRNYNRAHNKKIPSLQLRGTGVVKGKADKLMRTFEQCVTSRGVIFHKCCHLAAMENHPEKSRHLEKASKMNKNEAMKKDNRMKKI